MKKFIISIICILVLGAYFTTLNAQETENISFVSADIGTSYVLKSYSRLPDLKPNFNFGVHFGKQLNNVKSWHKNYNYPGVGAGLFFARNNNKIIGDVIAIYPEASFIVKNKNKHQCRITSALGIAYFSNPYHPVTNNLNMLIGSHVTAIAKADVCYRFLYSPRLAIQISLVLIHFSNGHVKLPNIGINMPQVSAGATYNFNDELRRPPLTKTKYNDIKTKAIIRYGNGFHQFGESAKPYGGPVYKNTVVSIGAAHNYSAVAYLSFGVNFTYYSSFYHFLLDQEVFGEKSLFYESCMITIYGAHEFLFGKLGVYTEFGIDIYKPFYRKYALYYDNKLSMDEIIKSFNSNKLGLQYHFFKPLNSGFDIALGVYIKSNFAQADFIECALNFAF